MFYVYDKHVLYWLCTDKQYQIVYNNEYSVNRNMSTKSSS